MTTWFHGLAPTPPNVRSGASWSASTGCIVGDGDGITIYPNAGPNVYIKSDGVRIAGLPTDLTTNWPGSFPGAVVATPAGQLYRLIVP